MREIPYITVHTTGYTLRHLTGIYVQCHGNISHDVVQNIQYYGNISRIILYIHEEHTAGHTKEIQHGATDMTGG
jgi:hypothetical protein